MKKAVNIAIEQGILVDFLKKHSSEVRNMLTLEYNEEIAKKVEREEAREEGRQEGRKEARKDLIRNCLKNGKSCEMISEFFDIPLEEVRKVKDNM